MINYQTIIHVEKYIAHPYWPEREKLINITKESGMNRARSSANRRKALEEYLKSQGMSLAEFEELERLAERQFYRDAQGNIVIPDNQMGAMLVATCDTIRAAGRPAPPEQVRSLIRVSAFTTAKTDPDGVWERFAVVTGGAGNKLSNQRALRRNEYIEDFDATGSFTFSPEFVRPEVLHKALQWAGTNIGVGASRKMGWGRFTISAFEAKS